MAPFRIRSRTASRTRCRARGRGFHPARGWRSASNAAMRSRRRDVAHCQGHGRAYAARPSAINVRSILASTVAAARTASSAEAGISLGTARVLKAGVFDPTSDLSSITERRWSDVSLSYADHGRSSELGLHRGAPARLSWPHSADNGKAVPKGAAFAYRLAALARYAPMPRLSGA